MISEGSRVQRLTSRLPVLHLEPEVPRLDTWTVVVDGMVSAPVKWALDRLKEMVTEKRTWDLHCVWGWTRPGCEWEGIPVGRLIDAAGPIPGASHVMATGWGDHYTSCLSINRARRSLLAWRLDGADLEPEHGGPVRLVPPPNKWGYKHVKWITRLTLISSFTPGFWEGLVGDPDGEVPREVIGHVDTRPVSPEGGEG